VGESDPSNAFTLNISARCPCRRRRCDQRQGGALSPPG